jgi:hypothetical protein
VAANVKRRVRSREFDGLFERRPVRHESSAGEDALAMSLYNPLIDAAGEAKIIRVDHQLPRHAI